MAKRKQFIKPFADSEVKIGFEERHGQDREDFTEQGLTIKWSWIRRLIDILIEAREKRKKRNAKNK